MDLVAECHERGFQGIEVGAKIILMKKARSMVKDILRDSLVLTERKDENIELKHVRESCLCNSDVPKKVKDEIWRM